MKNEFLHIRISKEVKELLTQLSSRYGMSVSEYVRYLVMEEARRQK